MVLSAQAPAALRDETRASIGRDSGWAARVKGFEEFSMSSRRTAKVAEAVREEVSTTILFGLKDPRVKNVTVTRVEVSPDLRNAKVYVSVMGDEKMQKLTLRGLESARGFLQAKLAERVQIRYTPILHFELDQGIKRSIEASRLLREVLPPTEKEPQNDLGDLEDETGDERIEDQNPSADESDDEIAHAEPNPPSPARAIEAAEDQDRSPAKDQL
jgi:ribosome-binding factor A